MDKCIACGLCAQKCPKKVDDPYNVGISKRKAIYLQYSQTVPLKYAIDPESCLYTAKGKCQACVKFCPTGAINFDDQGETRAINVGSVILAPGTYTGAGNRDLDFNEKTLVLRSESGPEATVLDIQASYLNPHRAVLFINVGSSAVFEGFTIVNGYMGQLPSQARAGTARKGRGGQDPQHDLSGGGIKCNGSAPTIRNVHIYSCASEYTGGAISIELLSAPTVVDCIFQRCVAGGFGGGMSVETGSHPEVSGCVITGNRANYGGGVFCEERATITNCVVSGNWANRGGAMACLFPAVVDVEQSILWGNCSPDTTGEIFVDLDATVSFTCSALDSTRIVSVGLAVEPVGKTLEPTMKRFG